MRKLIIILLIILVGCTSKYDINNDGKVSITDLVQLRRMVDGIQQHNNKADINNDGVVDIFDLTILREYLSRRTNGN